MSGTSEIAVAVVSFNTRELLGRCLDSLRADAEAGRARVTVVDNASADGSAELVRDSYPWAELIAETRNLGFGAAVDLVAERAAEPWLAAANADVELAPGALAALLEAGHADPGAGALAPRLVLADGTTQHSVHAFPSLGLALAFNSGLARAVPGLGERLALEGRWDPERPRAVDWAHGAFLLLRREAFAAAGGFDPRQWMYAEDLDLCWRLAGAGWTTRYVPAARVAHAHAAATREAFGDQLERRQMDAAAEWMERRRGRATARSYAAINAAGCALRLGVLRVAAPLSGRDLGGRRALEARYLRLHRTAMRRGGGR